MERPPSETGARPKTTDKAGLTLTEDQVRTGSNVKLCFIVYVEGGGSEAKIGSFRGSEEAADEQEQVRVGFVKVNDLSV